MWKQGKKLQINQQINRKILLTNRKNNYGKK